MDEKVRKVLICGCAGYIGSVLVPYLLGQGHRVVGLDSLMYGGHGLLGVYGHPDFTFYKGDIRDLELLTMTCRDCEVVINLAALVGEPVCAKSKVEAQSVNTNALVQLMNVAKRQGVEYLFHASTCSNYGSTTSQKLANEKSPLYETGVYSRTKIASEQIVLSTKNISTVIMRFATAFGLSPRMRFDLLLNEFVRDAVVDGRLLVYGARSWRPFVHVRDIAIFIGLMLDKRNDLRHDVYNIGGYNRRKEDLSAAIETIVGLQDTDIEFKHGQSDVRDYRVDFSRALQELKYKPRFTPEDGIAEMASALRDGLFDDAHSGKYRNL